MKRTLAVAALALASCTAPTPPPAQDGIALSQRCTNSQYGISISYPEGWYTNDGSVLPGCSAFDTKPVIIPADSELPFDIPVTVRVEKTAVQKLMETSQWERVLSSTPMTLHGKKAHRVELEATGDGLADRGMRTLRYVVDLGGGRVFTATTNGTGAKYEENKKILARMMERVTLP